MTVINIIPTEETDFQTKLWVDPLILFIKRIERLNCIGHCTNLLTANKLQWLVMDSPVHYFELGIAVASDMCQYFLLTSTVADLSVPSSCKI